MLERLAEDDAQHPAVTRIPDVLDPRARRIVELRFFEEKTQSQIAAELGISQMHVSRLLARTLEKLRSSLSEAGVDEL